MRPTTIRKLINKLFSQRQTPSAASNPPLASQPIVVSKDKHSISHSHISRNALKVLDRLQQAGMQAYLVGGSVRDLLLGLTPKDFDVATNAHPENVKQLFRNSRLIGRRFRLVHVFFGSEIIEVATFRAAHDPESMESRRSETGMILRDNIYGNIVDDAWRRDFGINSLYYDISKHTVLDYTGGMADLDAKVIRILGDARARYHEDPIRMLRAIRLAAKINFSIHPETAKPISELCGLLLNVPPSRLFDEIVKLFHSGNAFTGFNFLRHYGLFSVLFPQTEACLSGPDNHNQPAVKFIELALKNTDDRVKNHQSLNPAFIFAVLLWWPLQNNLNQFEKHHKKNMALLQNTITELFQRQTQHIAIPKRITAAIREIWVLQQRLKFTRSKRVLQVVQHRRFRAAYDFLLLRVKAGEPLQEQVSFWEKLQSEPHVKHAQKHPEDDLKE